MILLIVLFPAIKKQNKSKNGSYLALFEIITPRVVE
jgi:hypothetical protein